ncbi:hypothetical protein BGM19_05435 [Streptomyces agglomeratus]|nr:hypothetical protein BGM19_05435 [Streptomyces agglomeratus]
MPSRTLLPAFLPRPSRNPSANVCGVCLMASQPPLAPAETVLLRSKPSWAPKPTLTDCLTRSVTMAWTAETAGSFIASMMACISASLSASRMRRTARRVIWVAAMPAAADRPKVTTEAAAAAAIWMARAMSWTMTAYFANSTKYAAASKVFAMM